jgi:hypothetical protein
MAKPQKYVVIEDTRTNKFFIDLTGSIVRNFEKIVCSSNNKDYLKEKYPTATDVSMRKGTI